MDNKQRLRARLKAQRKAHVEALPKATKSLLFMRPPASVAAMVPEGAVVGLYAATAFEAPTTAYARWFHENGRSLALPWFAARGAEMQFRKWSDPYDPAALVSAPYGARQPRDDAAQAIPDIVIVPLIGFTATCDRLGQGGGHYDRWLSAHRAVVAIGLGWDCQLVDTLPLEPHDRRLAAIITPTRLFASPGFQPG